MPDPTPLSTLLSWTWVAYTIETDNAFEAVSADRVGRCVRISLPMWTNGLRHIDEDGVTVDQLRASTHAVCNIGGLERWGWISVGDISAERRSGYGSHRGVTGDTVLRPTAAGRFARDAWPTVVEQVEAQWRTRFGPGVIGALRDVLSERSPANALPWSPPEVSPSDGFRTRVIDSATTSDTDLPFVALLGRVLTNVTLEHERHTEASLPLAANLLRVVAAGNVRLRDLPRLGGISKQAVAMAVSYLDRQRLADVTTERSISLTARGLAALEGYRRRCREVDDARLRSALGDLLGQRSALSAGLTPPPGGWRAANPYLAQTRRVLADPIAALPWQAMVLHRAGWPDGS